MTTIPKHPLAKPPLVLIDGSSYLYRAFHALPPLTNSKGQATGAVYGVLNMIRKLINDYEPEYIAVVFDAKGKTFRDDLYPKYKANRPPMPDELRSQIQPLHDIIHAMGLPLLAIEGVEADDVIGTLATQADQQGMHTLISTGDKDMAQLVNDHVTLINTMTNKLLDNDGVKDKFAVEPKQIIDYLTLIGDSVDNIPGVPKVGPKTAAKWLDEHKTLDNIIAHADTFKGKVGENLRQSLEQLPLSRQLVTIKHDVELPIKISELKPQAADQKALIEYYGELEFKRWLSEQLGEDSPEETKLTKKNYEIILTNDQFKQWLNKLKQAEYFAFDTETTSLNYMQAELVGVSFATQAHEAAYLPLTHDYPGAPEQLDKESVLQQLKPLLEDVATAKIGQNLKYDMGILANVGIRLQGIENDTMLESYIINSSGNRHDMDTLALKYLGCNTIRFADIAGKGAKQLTFNQIALEQAAPYAAEDADITLQLHEKLHPMLNKHPGLLHVYKHIEMPLVSVLSHMERRGVLIDAPLLQQQSGELGKRLQALENKAYKIAGETFNLASPKQLQTLLFDKLGLPVLKKTPKGQPSTAENVLQELALDYPLPKIILEYRSLSKLKSTYTDKLPEQINPKTGRIHTSYHQAVAATGRLSSSDPNLQNIPVRTEEGRRIRKAFTAPAGKKIVAADYSQIELRIMAHLSKDESLLKAFSNGMDIHRATAAEVFSVAPDAVTSEQRRGAKAINFGLLYGMSAFGLAQQLNIEPKEAQAYVDLYFSRYPGVKTYMENTRKQAHEQGYVETLYGRRLYLAEINARNIMRQRAAERMAINAPLQGTAADIIKLAMIKIDAWLQQQSIDADMIMQVHDELVFEVAESDVETLINFINKAMCENDLLSIPLAVAIGVGDCWDEAH